MLNLASITSKLQIVTSAAGGVAIDTSASWVDYAAAAASPGETINAQITGAGGATTDLVTAPAAATKRNVRGVRIYNAHATDSNTVRITTQDGTNTRSLIKAILKAGEALVYEDGDGWATFDANGARKAAGRSGLWLKTTVLTAGVTFTTGPDTNTILVRVVGGGGGGGGCTSVAAAAAAAGGGGAGAPAEKTFAVTPNTNYTYAIGGGGAGVSGAAGANGGNSTFAVGATTVTAPGGTGGPQAVAATTLTGRAGGAGGAVATNGDVNGGGAPGEYGVVLIVATPIVASGAGGSGPFGGGGLGIVAVGNGNNATGFGAGGGGAATGASAVRTGGNGTAGCIVVDEYA